MLERILEGSESFSKLTEVLEASKNFQNMLEKFWKLFEASRYSRKF